MRAPLLVLALLSAGLAGCITGEPTTTATIPGRLGPVEVPDGAVLVEDVGRAVLQFAGVKLPFETNVTLPEGATIVRAVADVAKEVRVAASMWNQETGRRRCNTDALNAWDVFVTRVATCSGVAAIDPPGTRWSVRATGPVGGVADVQVVFETTPVDGLMATLDLSQISMPTFEVQETQMLKVPSWDGVPLHVEVTLPAGEGPWPTVLASSPYNGQYRRVDPAMWRYFTHDWAKRGYAIVNADVRGFGWSGGCVEVWGINEQKDQAFLVDWVASQDWSDGNVGFYGQSYVATTPVAAAVFAPEALKAIIAVAPVISAYDDWHYGGVPNGENTGSPVAYQVLTDPVPVPNPQALDAYPASLALLTNKAKGICDPTLLARANDPRAVYDAFYAERDFSLRAGDIKAAVLYTQGFEDLNVKSAMIPLWFNAITAPKLGLFGHWAHQHPTRADEEILFLGWMDQHVKGRPVGFPTTRVEVVVDNELHRVTDAWPPVESAAVELQADLGTGALAAEASGPGVDLLLVPALGANAPAMAPAREIVVLSYELTEDFPLVGAARLAIEGTLRGAGNAWFSARIRDVGPDGSALVTYGMFNLAHRNGHETYAPTHMGETSRFELPFLPTEYVFRAGHVLRLEITGALPTSYPGAQPGVYGLGSGAATRLLLPTLDVSAYTPTPATATP